MASKLTTILARSLASDYRSRCHNRTFVAYPQFVSCLADPLDTNAEGWCYWRVWDENRVGRLLFQKSPALMKVSF